MLEVSQLGKTYGEGDSATHAIGSISFGIDEGEFVCVVGPSGCGKTTLLKCIAGLLQPSRGEVTLNGRRVTRPPEEIARALAYQPSVLLMDEPFASVDAQTRGDLEDLVLGVREQFGITIVFVTHDIDESVYLSDRVIVLTHSPTEVKEVVPVDLPKPRDQIETKEVPEFAHLRAHVYRLI